MSAAKVDLDFTEAIFAQPNNTLRFAEPPPSGVPVLRGPTLDGIGKYLVEEIEESPEPPADVPRELRARGADEHAADVSRG